MVEPIYCLKPAWCGRHLAGLRPETGLTVRYGATAFKAVGYHSNLLHRSDENRSDKQRWSMICCYNAARNDPYKESHHPRYTPLVKVSNSAIREIGCRGFSDSNADIAWLERKKDQSANSLSQSGQQRGR